MPHFPVSVETPYDRAMECLLAAGDLSNRGMLPQVALRVLRNSPGLWFDTRCGAESILGDLKAFGCLLERGNRLFLPSDSGV